MDQFLEHQQRVQQSFRKWEMEKQKQHEISMERWRTQSKEHEKEMFGMFVQVKTGRNFLDPFARAHIFFNPADPRGITYGRISNLA